MYVMRYLPRSPTRSPSGRFCRCARAGLRARCSTRAPWPAGPVRRAPPSHVMPRRRVSSSVRLPPFQTLIDAHGRETHRFLVASVGRHDADDCYPEPWPAALRAYPKLRDASNLRSWIFTVAHRKVIDHVRARRRQAVPVGDVPEPAMANEAANPHDDDLWARVRDLPPKQRTALALRYVADAGYDEISNVMGTSEDAARRNVHEALKRLRTEYRP